MKIYVLGYNPVCFEDKYIYYIRAYDNTHCTDIKYQIEINIRDSSWWFTFSNKIKRDEIFSKLIFYQINNISVYIIPKKGIIEKIKENIKTRDLDLLMEEAREEYD